VLELSAKRKQNFRLGGYPFPLQFSIHCYFHESLQNTKRLSSIMQCLLLCIWWVRTSFFILRLHQGFNIDPIYSLASSSEYLEIFGIRAELLRVSNLPAERDLSSWGVWHFIRPRSHLIIHALYPGGLWRLVASLLHLVEAYLHFVIIY
jgi:hypothetical protein